MKKLLLLTALCVASPAFSADWTPYFDLSDLNNGSACMKEGFEQILKKERAMPQSLKKDIVRHTIKKYRTPGLPSGYEDAEATTTYTIVLKNATAFGQPISSIELFTGYEDYLMTIKFRNASFYQKLPRQVKDSPTTKIDRKEKTFKCSFYEVFG